METPYILMILGAVFTLVGIIYTIFTNRIKSLEVKCEDHDKRIQTIEDLQGSKIDMLISRVDKMEITLENLKSEVHLNKNLVSQMNSTLSAVNTWIINQK